MTAAFIVQSFIAAALQDDHCTHPTWYVLIAKTR